MDWLTGILLPIALFAIAVLIGRFELTLYQDALDELGPLSGATGREQGLFVYSRGRFRRRMFGVAVLVVTGGTLMVVELFPAQTAGVALLHMAALITEVVVLLLVPLVDLWETGRTRMALPTRPGDPDRERRSLPDRPR